MPFQVGQQVKWTSQATGSWKEKVGDVVEVVPAGARPKPERFPSLYAGGCGFGRYHESYVVRVGKKYYWPIASKLQPA